jgi:uncharacterized protein DUF1553
LIEGAGHVYAAVASHAMINGPLHAELVKDTGGNSDLPTRWITHDLSRYAGERVHLEFIPKEGEDFRVLMVVEGRERPAAPVNRPNKLLARFMSTAPVGDKEAALRGVVESTLDALVKENIAQSRHPADTAAIANWLIRQMDEPQPAELAESVTAYLAARKKLIEKIPAQSRLCLAMWDGNGVDEHLLIRGNHKTVGPVVPRRMLEALQEPVASSQGPEGMGSRRLELARQLVDRDNPLVSRVIVNRVWQHLMGRGIVPSVDNLGVLGERPTHPELLDYLAVEFMRDGWSLKRLIRRIMLSSTYRQGSGFRVQKRRLIRRICCFIARISSGWKGRRFVMRC